MPGKKIDLADLANDTAGTDRGVPGLDEANQQRTTARRTEVAANPHNPRKDLGDVEGLAASLAEVGQLEPCTVVTRPAFVGLYPEQGTVVGAVSYVAVTGARRLAAAEIAGLDSVAIVVRNEVAASRETFEGAALAENVARENLGPIEEAQAVARLVKMCGSQRAAAARLGRTQPWVSQRQTLLRLPTELQQQLTDGAITVVQALDLARSSTPASDKAFIAEVDGTSNGPAEPAGQGDKGFIADDQEVGMQETRGYRAQREIDRFAKAVRRIPPNDEHSRVAIATAALQQTLTSEERAELGVALTNGE